MLVVCKSRIRIGRYILGYLNTKEGMAGGGVRLREYILNFPLNAIHCCKLKTITNQNQNQQWIASDRNLEISIC